MRKRAQSRKEGRLTLAWRSFRRVSASWSSAEHDARSSRLFKFSFRNARVWETDVEVDGGKSKVCISCEVVMVVVRVEAAM